MDSLCR